MYFFPFQLRNKIWQGLSYLTFSLTGSLDTSTDWHISGASTSKNCSHLSTSASLVRGQAENSLGCQWKTRSRRKKINTCKSQHQSVVSSADPNVYHDVDFEFAFLNDGCTAQGQTLIGVMILKSFPHSCHHAVTPNSPLDPHLKHLARQSWNDFPRLWCGQSLFVNVYSSKCWELTWSGAKVHKL